MLKNYIAAKLGNKVLIKLIVPELDNTFDIFIPVNEIIWKVKKLIIKSIYDLTGGALEVNREYTLINKLNSMEYDNNAIIIKDMIIYLKFLISVKEDNNNIININSIK